MVSSIQREEMGMAVKIQFKSVRCGSEIGLVMIQPDGYPRLVARALMPLDDDWRADVQFYDELERAYKTRMRKAMEQYQ